MSAIRLHEVDMTGIVTQTPSLGQLSEVGVQSTRQMRGIALTTDNDVPVAHERGARDANPDNPGILTCLRAAGVPVSSYKDFRQLETVGRPPRAQPGYRALLDFAAAHMKKIGEQHRIDTSQRMGGTGGFAISLITDAAAENILGFLGHNDTGERIFLSRDGDLARVWYA